MGTPDPDLTPEQIADAERIYLTLRRATEEEHPRMARLLARKGDAQLFGQTEYEVRDLAHEAGAKATTRDNRRRPGDGDCTGLEPILRRLAAIYHMLTFMEFLAQSRRMGLPDTHTLLAMIGVPLGFPDGEETQRLLNRDKKRRPAGGKIHKTIVPLDCPPARTARKQF